MQVIGYTDNQPIGRCNFLRTSNCLRLGQRRRRRSWAAIGDVPGSARKGGRMRTRSRAMRRRRGGRRTDGSRWCCDVKDELDAGREGRGWADLSAGLGRWATIARVY